MGKKRFDYLAIVGFVITFAFGLIAVSEAGWKWNNWSYAAISLLGSCAIGLPLYVCYGPKERSKGIIPDFTAEWAERDRLMQRCAGDVEETEAVWAWIIAVYNKLMAWKPLRAMEFKPDQPAVTQTGGRKISPVTAQLLSQGVKVNHSRRTLKEYGDRLAKILNEEG